MREYIWYHTPRYIQRILIGTDEYLNIWLNGRVGECISSRVGRNVLEGEFWSTYLFMPILDFICGKGHCINSIESLQKDHI